MIVDDPTGDDRFNSASERLLALIGAGIISGDLAPGEKLTEIGLSKRYGVSRAPLREALLRLEERQLIVRMPFSGTRVASPSLRTLGELYEVRAVCSRVLRRGAPRLPPRHTRSRNCAQPSRTARERCVMRNRRLPQAGSPTPHRPAQQDRGNRWQPGTGAVAQPRNLAVFDADPSAVEPFTGADAGQYSRARAYCRCDRGSR